MADGSMGSCTTRRGRAARETVAGRDDRAGTPDDADRLIRDITNPGHSDEQWMGSRGQSVAGAARRMQVPPLLCLKPTDEFIALKGLVLPEQASGATEQAGIEVGPAVVRGRSPSFFQTSHSERPKDGSATAPVRPVHCVKQTFRSESLPQKPPWSIINSNGPLSKSDIGLGRGNGPSCPEAAADRPG
jgi:hypothetical protein